MKKLLTIFCLVLLVSCSDKPPPELPAEKVVERDGIYYGPFTGSSVSYHDNGQLKERGNYKNGNKEGLWVSFYKNGQLEQRGNFKDGKEDGLFENFDENGNLTKTETYKDGELIDLNSNP